MGSAYALVSCISGVLHQAVARRGSIEIPLGEFIVRLTVGLNLRVIHFADARAGFIPHRMLKCKNVRSAREFNSTRHKLAPNTFLRENFA